MAYQALPFNEGELEMHKLTKVPTRDNPMNPGLSPRAAQQISVYPLMAVGTTDPNDDNRPWTSLWGGEAPMAQVVAAGGIIGIRSTVDGSFDPVVNALLGQSKNGEVVKQGENGGAMVSALSISLEQRSRVKLFGRMMAGALNSHEDGEDGDGDKDGDASMKQGKAGNVQLVLKIEQSLGNCPKYLNRKDIKPNPNLKPGLLSDSAVLSDEAVDLIANADTIFVSSSHKFEDMDTNHRGGPPGFVRVQQPTSESPSRGTILVWPEYSGNNLYQTLGNLITTPRAGICIPDFTTGDVLYLTGDTEVLINSAASNIISKSRLAVKFTTIHARHIRNGLPFLATPIPDATQGQSPYNPRIRYLKSEKPNNTNTNLSSSPQLTAKLIQKTNLSPSITKYRFSLSDSTALGPWLPGQYVVLDFSQELDMGYSHMRDDDPGSLNDDFIRTFTVSSPPGSLGVHGEEFELVVRKKGGVTQWLNMQNVERGAVVEVGVIGFGGEFWLKNDNDKDLDLHDTNNDSNKDDGFGGSNKNKKNPRKGVFIAAGVGITPLLGQIQVIKNLHLRWTISIRDIGLISEVLGLLSSEMKQHTIIYLTGDEGLLRNDTERKMYGDVMMESSSSSSGQQEQKGGGIKVERRRMRQSDLVNMEDEIDDWYLCTAPEFRLMVQGWIPNRTIVFENFDY